MRKLFAILSFCCLLFSTGGYHFYFQLRIAEVKLEMKKAFKQGKEEEQTKLALSDAERQLLNWESESEFRYQDEMYDVIKIEKQEDKTIIWCISDTKETSLVDQYLNAQQQSPEKNSSNEILKLLSADFMPSSVLVGAVPFQLKQTNYSSFQPAFSSSSFDVLSPPPKVC